MAQGTVRIVDTTSEPPRQFRLPKRAVAAASVVTVLLVGHVAGSLYPTTTTSTEAPEPFIAVNHNSDPTVVGPARG